MSLSFFFFLSFFSSLCPVNVEGEPLVVPCRYGLRKIHNLVTASPNLLLHEVQQNDEEERRKRKGGSGNRVGYDVIFLPSKEPWIINGKRKPSLQPKPEQLWFHLSTTLALGCANRPHFHKRTRPAGTAGGRGQREGWWGGHAGMSLSNVSTEISCDLQLHPQSISGNGMGSLGMNRFYWKPIILGMASCYHRH